MKILCFTTCLNAGGAERQLVGLASLLKGEGYEVSFLTFSKNNFYKGELDKSEIPFECLNKGANGLVKFIRIYRRVKEMEPDIVIAYLGIPSMVMSVCKMLGLKFRLLCSERITTNPMRVIDKLRCKLYRYADCIIPNSYTQAKILSDYESKLTSKIKVIPNFTDTEKFFPSEDVNYDRQIKVLSVGRIHAQKNILTYLDAVSEIVKKYRDIKFVWYGKNDDQSYYTNCINKIEELNLSYYFMFMPPENHIEKIYPEYDMFCLPSLYEGCPNVICEAMSSGLPILCSDVCDNSMIVDDGKNAFLFSPNDVNSICGAFDRMMSKTTDERHAMGKYGRELALKKFSKEKFLNEYISCF